MRMKISLWVLSLVAILSVKVGCAQDNPDVISYINTYKALAINEMQRTGIPACITLAQGIHESEAGTSELVKKSNNHFGIKCKDDWTGPTVYHDDDARGECFRGYASAADSYRDHSDFLRKGSRYAFLFNLDPTDYEGWANGLHTAGYATNSRYSQILCKLIKDYNLQQYTLIAMGRLKISDEVVLTTEGGNNRSLVDIAQEGSGGSEGQAGGALNGVAGAGVAGAGRTDGMPGSGLSGGMSGNGGQGGIAGAGVRGTDAAGTSAVNYPAGEFVINKSRVIYVKAGTSLLSIADQYNLPLARLLEFNDLKEQDVVERDQLIFLQRKRKTGSVEFHVAKEGESLYDICQAEGMRYQDLLDFNRLTSSFQLAAGDKIFLQSPAPLKSIVTEGRGGGGN